MDNIWIALVSFAGTALGVFGGIVTSGKLVNHRISELEKKQDKHNNLLERMVAVEQSTKSAHHRIDSVEGKIK